MIKNKCKPFLSANQALQEALAENFSLERRLATHKKTQVIDNSRTVSQKRRWGVSPNPKRKIMEINKHCSLITLIINGLNSQ